MCTRNGIAEFRSGRVVAISERLISWSCPSVAQKKGKCKGYELLKVKGPRFFVRVSGGVCVYWHCWNLGFGFRRWSRYCATPWFCPQQPGSLFHHQAQPQGLPVAVSLAWLWEAWRLALGVLHLLPAPVQSWTSDRDGARAGSSCLLPPSHSWLHCWRWGERACLTLFGLEPIRKLVVRSRS